MKIDYVELPARDLSEAKAFYGKACGWSFEDWGPDYMAFSEAGLEGGFRRTSEVPARGGALVILYCDDLHAAEKTILEAGGDVIEKHDFPGGSRFHFLDPSGNELAVWTKVSR